MANKHKTREHDTNPTVWARFKPGKTRFYVGPDRPDTNKRAGLRQKTRHGGLARHGPFTSKPVKFAFLH
jgi:hypothetical protein